MKTLEIIEAETEFTAGWDERLHADLRLVQALEALHEARDEITALRDEIDKLCAPPSSYGVYLSTNDDATVNVLAQGRKVRVDLHPSINPATIKPGQELVLNEGLNVVETAGFEVQGDVVILKEQLDPERALVTLRADEEKVGIIADPLRSLRLKTGIRTDDLLTAVREEFKENEDLPNTTNPDDSARIAGKKGERILHVRSLLAVATPAPRAVEKVVPTGQYL